MSSTDATTAHGIIEEITPVETIDVEDGPSGSEGESISDSSSEFEMEFDPVSQLTQLLVTEDGQPIADIMAGIKEALDKTNKILFKMSVAIEKGVQN